MKFLVVAAAFLITQVAAHYEFSSIIVNGNKTQPYEYVRKQYNGNSPVTDINSIDMRCNVGSQASAASTLTYTVPAGASVSFYIDWDVMGHPGPVQIYLSKAPSTANTYDGSGGWFKIFKTDAIYGSTLTFPLTGAKEIPFKIPARTPPGEYLLRIEHLALHGASTVGGAQFFIECAQLKITGSSTATPGPTIKFPGGYSATDPGILMNMYWPPVTSYTPPGPAVWS